MHFSTVNSFQNHFCYIPWVLICCSYFLICFEIFFPLWFLLDPLVVQKCFCLVHICIFSSLSMFYFYTVMIRKDSCFDLDLPKFAKLHFVSYYMSCSGDCFMCICEECVFCCNWMEWMFYKCLLGPFVLKCGSIQTSSFSVWMAYPLLTVGYWNPLYYIVVSF